MLESRASHGTFSAPSTKLPWEFSTRKSPGNFIVTFVVLILVFVRFPFLAFSLPTSSSIYIKKTKMLEAVHTNPPVLHGYCSRGGKSTPSVSRALLRMVRISHGRGQRSNHHREGSGWASEDSEQSFVWLASILFLTTNTIAAAIRGRDDPSVIAFVVSIYAFLLLFFWCVRTFDRLPQESQARERLKVPIWVLGSGLNLMFAHRVTLVVTASAMAWLVWALAASSCLFTFYFFFLHTEKPAEELRAFENKALLLGEM